MSPPSLLKTKKRVKSQNYEGTGWPKKNKNIGDLKEKYFSSECVPKKSGAIFFCSPFFPFLSRKEEKTKKRRGTLLLLLLLLPSCTYLSSSADGGETKDPSLPFLKQLTFSPRREEFRRGKGGRKGGGALGEKEVITDSLGGRESPSKCSALAFQTSPPLRAYTYGGGGEPGIFSRQFI